MTFRDVSPSIRSIPAAIWAGLVLLLAGALSILTINLAGQSAGFGFLPLIVLALWPRRASEIVSLFVIFIAGIFTDWAVGGVIGQSTLVFTLIWMLFRPELRDEPYAFGRLLVVWILICVVAAILIGLSGWFVYDIGPDLMSFARQFAVSTLVLPAAVVLRRWLASRFGKDDDWSR